MFTTVIPFIDQKHRWVQRIREGAYTRDAYLKTEHVPVFYLLSDEQIRHLVETHWEDVKECKAFLDSCFSVWVSDIQIKKDTVSILTEMLVDARLVTHTGMLVYSDGRCHIVHGLNDLHPEVVLGYIGVKS